MKKGGEGEGEEDEDFLVFCDGFKDSFGSTECVIINRINNNKLRHEGEKS